MNCSTPGFPVPYYLLELAQTVHWVVDALQPPHPSPTSLALTLCQHWGFRSHPTPVLPRLDSLYLQRPWFQIRSHSGIPCRHGFWGDTSTQYRLSFWTATFWGGLRLYCGIQLVDRVNYKESGEKTGSSFPSGSVVKIHLTMQETWAQSQGQEDPLEEGMATHSSILAWENSWTEEPDGLQAMELQSQTLLSVHAHKSSEMVRWLEVQKFIMASS